MILLFKVSFRSQMHWIWESRVSAFQLGVEQRRNRKSDSEAEISVSGSDFRFRLCSTPIQVSIDIAQVPPALDLYGEFGEFQQQNHHHEPQQQALEAGL